MLRLHPEFVVDEKSRKKAVLIPFSEWRRILDEIDELEDIRAYDKAKARKEEEVPFEEAVRRVRGKTRK